MYYLEGNSKYCVNIPCFVDLRGDFYSGNFRSLFQKSLGLMQVCLVTHLTVIILFSNPTINK